MNEIKCEAECRPCRGTGVYHGFKEPTGVGVVCQECDGSGKMIITYKPFTGRKIRSDIHVVCRSVEDAPDTAIAYGDFLKGKMP